MKPPDRWSPHLESSEQLEFRRHREELNRRLRAAFLAGAEGQSLADAGRGLTDREVAIVIEEYPGDLPTEP